MKLPATTYIIPGDVVHRWSGSVKEPKQSGLYIKEMDVVQELRYPARLSTPE